MQGIQVYFRTCMFTSSDNRSFQIGSILPVTEPSINFRANYAAMCVSSPNILASIVHHATAKGENCFHCLVNTFFYCIESGFCYFTKPVSFSLWRKNLEYDEETNAGLC